MISVLLMRELDDLIAPKKTSGCIAIPLALQRGGAAPLDRSWHSNQVRIQDCDPELASRDNSVVLLA